MLKDNHVLLFCGSEYAHRVTELSFSYVIADPLEQHDRGCIGLVAALGFEHSGREPCCGNVCGNTGNAIRQMRRHCCIQPMLLCHASDIHFNYLCDAVGLREQKLKREGGNSSRQDHHLTLLGSSRQLHLDTMAQKVLSVADYFAVPGAYVVTTREELLPVREVELTYECRGRAVLVQGRRPRRDQRSGMIKPHLHALRGHLASTHLLRLQYRSTMCLGIAHPFGAMHLRKREHHCCCRNVKTRRNARPKRETGRRSYAARTEKSSVR